MSKTESEDPNQITHRIIGAPGQAVGLFTIEKSDGTVVFNVDKDGILGTKVINALDMPETAYSGAQIEAAIAALPSGGGKVFIPEGLWVIDHSIRLNGPFIQLCGAGLATMLYANEGTLANGVIHCDSANRAIVRNMQIVGSGAVPAAHLTPGIVIENECYSLFFDNIYIYGTLHGIRITDSVAINFRNFLVQDAQWGVYLDGHALDGYVIGCNFHTGQVHVCERGIYSYGAVKNNRFENIAIETNTEYSIFLRSRHIGADSVTPHTNIFNGNWFEDCIPHIFTDCDTPGDAYPFANIFSQNYHAWYGDDYIWADIKGDNNRFSTNVIDSDGGHAALLTVSGNGNIFRDDQRRDQSVASVLTVANTGTNNKFIDEEFYPTRNSGVSTGIGAQQSIDHGLGNATSPVIPTRVLLSDIETGALAYQSAGADNTHLFITATLNKDYTWEAWIV